MLRLARQVRTLPAGGRLLVYFPEAELSDGAAEVATGGFFDVFNCPPWDTWLAFISDANPDPSYSSYLIAYVPPVLLELCAAGIEVNPEQCIVGSKTPRWHYTTWCGGVHHNCCGRGERRAQCRAEERTRRMNCTPEAPSRHAAICAPS
ncbi:MAG TPA: hypothetical protein VF092_30290 [Longimicrobium sp.]